MLLLSLLLLSLESASEYGPRFFDENMPFSRMFKDYSHKTIGSGIETSYVCFQDIFTIMVLASTSHECRRQAHFLDFIHKALPTP